MKTLIIVWGIGIVVTLPIVIAFCKAAKLGDKGNKLVDRKD